MNTNYGFYFCFRCDFVAHIDCATDYRYREYINLQELKEEENEDSELDQSVYLATYEVKNIKVGEDGTEIATEIQQVSHEHDLKLSDDEVLNNEKCNECVQAIFPPFYSCVNCSFFLHKSCAKLPRKNDTCFINTHLPSSQSHLMGGIRYLSVMPVNVVAMASSICVSV